MFGDDETASHVRGAHYLFGISLALETDGLMNVPGEPIAPPFSSVPPPILLINTTSTGRFDEVEGVGHDSSPTRSRMAPSAARMARRRPSRCPRATPWTGLYPSQRHTLKRQTGQMTTFTSAWNPG